MKLLELRKKYHQRVCNNLMRIHRGIDGEEYPNNAHGDSKISKDIARLICKQICEKPSHRALSSQKVSDRFKVETKWFVEKSFDLLQHLRPGNWRYSYDKPISNSVQYEYFLENKSIQKNAKASASGYKKDYIIESDLLISRPLFSDEEINKVQMIVNADDSVSMLTCTRTKNQDHLQSIPLASISCIWNLRSGKTQNIMIKAANLIRNRKGNLPHVVAVTAEPTLTRIASLALGTGDIDCVYHFALHELIHAVHEINDESQLDLLEILIDGKRLRDISDLPLDLAA